MKESVYQRSADGGQSVSYNEVSLEGIINGTGLNFLEAVDLLYIISVYRILADDIQQVNRLKEI